MSKPQFPERNFYDAHLAQGTKQFLCSDLVNRMFLLVLAVDCHYLIVRGEIVHHAYYYDAHTHVHVHCMHKIASYSGS